MTSQMLPNMCPICPQAQGIQVSWTSGNSQLLPPPWAVGVSGLQKAPILSGESWQDPQIHMSHVGTCVHTHTHHIHTHHTEPKEGLGSIRANLGRLPGEATH